MLAYEDFLEVTNEGTNKSDRLAVIISKGISSIDSEMDYKDFAKAVAKIMFDDYGTHNYKPFVQELAKELNVLEQ
jgi:hypothetical protein